ncbi:MAG: hypothetical protein JXP39_08785, partial [Spirochaetales bacterium]|nr:hypothetical protein [Spirochaetales bacterium]
MGAWSAVSKSRIALTVRRLFRLQQAAPLAVIVMLVHQPQLPAESPFAFRVSAQYSAPLGAPLFGSGPAVFGAFDVQPSTWSAVFLRAGYTGIPLDTGESIALTEGTLGASLRRRIGERLSVRGDLDG